MMSNRVEPCNPKLMVQTFDCEVIEFQWLLCVVNATISVL